MKKNILITITKKAAKCVYDEIAKYKEECFEKMTVEEVKEVGRIQLELINYAYKEMTSTSIKYIENIATDIHNISRAAWSSIFMKYLVEDVKNER